MKRIKDFEFNAETLDLVCMIVNRMKVPGRALVTLDNVGETLGIVLLDFGKYLYPAEWDNKETVYPLMTACAVILSGGMTAPAPNNPNYQLHVGGDEAERDNGVIVPPDKKGAKKG